MRPVENGRQTLGETRRWGDGGGPRKVSETLAHELAGNVRQRIAGGRVGEGKRVHLMLTGGRELSR